MTQQDETLLECRDVSFRYPTGDWILQNVSLQIGRHERVGLVGPSGYGEPLKTMFLEVGVWGEAPHIALLLFTEKQKGRFLEMPYGKSTLSKLLAGYELPDKGEIRWKGKQLPRRGYCPVQMIYQHPEKALDPRWRLKYSLGEGWNPDAALLERLGIRTDLWLDRYPNELSGGELQRFCVARILGPQTECIIADEMSTMLDAITQAHIWNVLLEETERREIGLIVITHHHCLAERLCTRIIDLRELNGK